MDEQSKVEFELTPREWAALVEKQREENARQADFITRLMTVAERLGHVTEFLLMQIDPRDMALAEAQAAAAGKLVTFEVHKC
jgi:hypothetical protein